MNNIMSTFETFIEDKSNRFALAACQAISEHPSEYYNPLWIYGESACGKSHLLNAIFHKLELEQIRIVLYLTAEALVETMISNFKSKDEAWTMIENADVLIIDNTEHLKGKNTTQEEIALLSLRKQTNKQQVIFASNCPPIELPTLNRLFRERAEMGLFADIQPPSIQLKRKYVEKFMKNEPFQITEEATELLISKLKTIPQLNGALRTARFSSVKDKLKIETTWVQNHINKFKELQ